MQFDFELATYTGDHEEQLVAKSMTGV